MLLVFYDHVAQSSNRVLYMSERKELEIYEGLVLIRPVARALRTTRSRESERHEDYLLYTAKSLLKHTQYIL